MVSTTKGLDSSHVGAESASSSASAVITAAAAAAPTSNTAALSPKTLNFKIKF